MRGFYAFNNQPTIVVTCRIYPNSNWQPTDVPDEYMLEVAYITGLDNEPITSTIHMDNTVSFILNKVYISFNIVRISLLTFIDSGASVKCGT